ncbi:putative SAC1 phosphoinositide phosphatase [Toxoplasma gondii CAST]|uniref:Putative SAC1 phosphoinositide phosphatase n=1 Tax=Toxoplasma gondii CAST TaxID=943122 RepID=A0A3R8AGS4_TOXGO|nr:putative SAC1 phosphoinositide phosphatase [Toxoplasma gondii CAST]
MDASAVLAAPFVCEVHHDRLVLRSRSSRNEKLTFTCSSSETRCFSVATEEACPSLSSPQLAVPCYGLFGVTQIFGSAYLICISSCRLLGFLAQAPLLQITSFHLVQVPTLSPQSSHSAQSSSDSRAFSLTTRTVRRRRFLQSSSQFLVGATVTITSRASAAAARPTEETAACGEGVSPETLASGAQAGETVCGEKEKTGRSEAVEKRRRRTGEESTPTASSVNGPAVASRHPAPPPPGVRTPHDGVAEQWLTLLCDALCEGGFYFSPSLDLTKNLQTQLGGVFNSEALPIQADGDERKFGKNSSLATQTEKKRSDAWTDRFSCNRHFREPITKQTPEALRFCAQVIQGYVGIGLVDYSLESCTQLCLISRRDSSRTGARFHSRGINLAGDASNMVETEQLLLVYTFRGASPLSASLPSASSSSSASSFSSVSEALASQQHQQKGASVLRLRGTGRVDLFSFVQIRGSLPLVWKQTPTMKWAPPAQVVGAAEENAAAAALHFDGLLKHYGPTCVVNLINKKGWEKSLGDLFEQLVAEQKSKDLSFIWFDFHHECSKMRWNNLSRLLEQAHAQLKQQQYFHAICTSPAENDAATGAAGKAFFSWSEPLRALPGWKKSEVCRVQRGVCRINCIDCLDRTNVVESVFGKRVLAELLVATRVQSAPLAQTSSPQLSRTPSSLASSRHSKTGGRNGEAASSLSRSSSSLPQHCPSSSSLSPTSSARDSLPVDFSAEATELRRRLRAEEGERAVTDECAQPLTPLPFTPPEGDQLFRDLWTDNADALSLLYSGTPALKTDFTRTGVRSRWGALSDARNSFIRYFLNNFFDGYKHDCITFFYQAASFSASSSLFSNLRDASPPRPLGAGLRRAAKELLLLSFSLFCLAPGPSLALLSGVHAAGYAVTGALLALAALPFRAFPFSLMCFFNFFALFLPSSLRPFSPPTELFPLAGFGATEGWGDGVSELLRDVGGCLWLFTFAFLSFFAYLFFRAAAVVSLPQLLPDVS